MKTFTPIVLIVIAFGLFFFEVRPLYSKVSQLRVESDQYDQALKMADELKKIRVDLAHTLDNFSAEDLARLDHFLPKNLDTVRIILDIDALASRDGVRLIGLQVTDSGTPVAQPVTKIGGPAINKAPFNTVDVSFSFTGSYAQGKQFILDLQRSLRLLDSTALSITPSTKIPGMNDFKMTLQTYWINR